MRMCVSAWVRVGVIMSEWEEGGPPVCVCFPVSMFPFQLAFLLARKPSKTAVLSNVRHMAF